MTDQHVPEIAPLAAAEAVNAGAFLLDVREPEEWLAGHAPEAHHIALGDLAARRRELPEDVEIVVVCRSGARSLTAATALRQAGRRAANLAGGMQAWQAAGLEVVAENGPGVVI